MLFMKERKNSNGCQTKMHYSNLYNSGLISHDRLSPKLSINLERLLGEKIVLPDIMIGYDLWL